MNKSRRVIQHSLLVGSALVIPSIGASADGGLVLPPMYFESSVAVDELYSALKTSPAFGQLDKESVGSPIILVVTHSLRATAAGTATGLLTAMTTGISLGLLPLVTNKTLVVRYSIRVNGTDVATFSYEHNLTRAINIWTEKNDTTYGLGHDGLVWVESTAASFGKDAEHDPRLSDLRREYDLYFGDSGKQ